MKPFLILLIISTSLFATVSVNPTDSNIRFSGVVDTVNTASGLELYRLKKSYVDAPWSVTAGAWSQKNAGAQSGIIISIKTASPTVKFNFALNSTYEDRWARMILNRDGSTVAKEQKAAGSAISSISATSTDGDTAVWSCILPVFKAHYFKGVELDNGYSLEPMGEDARPAYIAIGNSITHGVGQSAACGNLTYPYLIADKLGYQLYNFGVGGSKFNTAILNNIDGITPKLITVLWGYNNVVFLADDLSLSLQVYDTLMTKLVTDYPKATIVAIEQTFTNSTVGKNNTSNTIADLRAGQKKILSSLQKNHTNLHIVTGLNYTDSTSLYDDVHLNDSGAASLARGVLAELGQLNDTVPNIFVSTTGDDGVGDGTEAKPYKTIAYAMTKAIAGDTVFVLPGTYTNTGFGSGEKNNGNIAYISNIHGEEGKYIVLMSKDPGKAKLKFDGSGALIFSTVSYIEVNGFDIEGPGANIDTAEARTHRLDNPVLPYYSGRGIAFWGKSGNHHIIIRNNRVHHCPNSGIRANYVDYITIENNDVWQNCWWAPNAESGLVIAQATNSDSADTIKITIRNNRVFNNGNLVIYYNPNYGDGSDYGQPGYTEIVDGQGIYITRSNDTYLFGKFLIENNLSVNNGINGICFHHSDRGIIRNNTLYENGQYPDRPVSGITINGADLVQVYNNIVVARDDGAIQNYENSTNIVLQNNLIWSGINSFDSGATIVDPLFEDADIDPTIADFSLQNSSPAIDAGASLSVATTDILGNSRVVGGAVDIGAYESQSGSAIISKKNIYFDKNRLSISPFGLGLRVDVSEPITIKLVSLNGRLIKKYRVKSSTIIGESLSSGVYFISAEGQKFFRTLKFIKQ